MEVVFLGTGNAFASGGRHHMAVLLRGDGIGALLDCGPSALVALEQQGLGSEAVDVVLLSHLHGDHFGGVPMLAVDGRYGARRAASLRVYGPAGTREVLEKTIALFYPSMEDAPLAIQDVAPGEASSHGPLTFQAFEVDHFSTGTALGYRVTLGGKTVVFSGDTAWGEHLVTQSAGADLFICECSSFGAPEGKHVAHTDLQRNHERLRAKRTILVHAGEDVIARSTELVFELAQDGRRIQL